VAAKYLADPNRKQDLLEKGTQVIKWEKAMGSLSKRQADGLCSTYSRMKSVLSAERMKETMVDAMVKAKVAQCVKNWRRYHLDNSSLKGEPPKPFTETYVGRSAKNEMKYEIDLDYDGISMHTAALTMRYTERVGLDTTATAFESNRTADMEESARAQEAAATKQLRTTKKKIKEGRKLELEATKTLASASMTKSIAESMRGEELMSQAQKILQPSLIQEQKLTEKISKGRTTKEMAESKWIQMAGGPKGRLYMRGMSGLRMVGTETKTMEGFVRESNQYEWTGPFGRLCTYSVSQHIVDIDERQSLVVAPRLILILISCCGSHACACAIMFLGYCVLCFSVVGKHSRTHARMYACRSSLCGGLFGGMGAWEPSCTGHWRHHVVCVVRPRAHWAQLPAAVQGGGGQPQLRRAG
jgi:hypothetical protein